MNTKLIKDWLHRSAPNAKAKLSVKTGISISMIEKIMCGQYAPEKPRLSWALANALGVTEEELLRDEPAPALKKKSRRTL